MYIELHAASAFSFLQGASLPETLVARAAALGYSALALLDADGVYGAPRFHRAATQAGMRAIIGAELTMTGYDASQIANPGSPPSPSARYARRNLERHAPNPNPKIANRQSPTN